VQQVTTARSSYSIATASALRFPGQHEDQGCGGAGSSPFWEARLRGHWFVRAQQSDRVRRIGVLMGTSEGDLEPRLRVATFLLGWVVGRNVAIDYRWAMGRADLARLSGNSREPSGRLEGVAAGNAYNPYCVRAGQRTCGPGFVSSLARPGGNITGFSYLEPTIGAKWLEFLKQIAPQTTRVAVMLNPDTTPFNVAFSRISVALVRRSTTATSASSKMSTPTLAN
jgi:putative ABC transport system substrate-binding protein